MGILQTLLVTALVALVFNGEILPKKRNFLVLFLVLFGLIISIKPSTLPTLPFTGSPQESNLLTDENKKSGNVSSLPEIVISTAA